jgi:NAD-dependent SIR2 family protein deacetylase
MPNKTVLIAGAGFSAPAQFPLQNIILQEMAAPQPNSFLDINNEIESIKFLHTYINVGIYLLIKYAGDQYKYLLNDYNTLLHVVNNNAFVAQLFKQINNTLQLSDTEIKDLYQFMLQITNKDKQYSELIIFKEKIRSLWNKENITVSLEDVFTSFDKSFILREYLENYPYDKIDKISHLIVRLLTYYFEKRIKNHKLTKKDYSLFINFINKCNSNISVITTNWDTLIELYFRKNNIQYDLSLNDCYYHFDVNSTNIQNINNKNIANYIKLIKIHGSINWLKCLNCGTILIIEKIQNSMFLFNDNNEEVCPVCEYHASDNEILLQPEIITPSMTKSFDNQLYRNLWRSARNELVNAEKIIFIGYSFPIADYEFRHLLQKNIPHTATIDVILYKNDNPTRVTKKNEHLKFLLPEKRFKESFYKNNIEFFYDGFKTYFKNQLC